MLANRGYFCFVRIVCILVLCFLAPAHGVANTSLCQQEREIVEQLRSQIELAKGEISALKNNRLAVGGNTAVSLMFLGVFAVNSVQQKWGLGMGAPLFALGAVNGVSNFVLASNQIEVYEQLVQNSAKVLMDQEIRIMNGQCLALLHSKATPTNQDLYYQMIAVQNAFMGASAELQSKLSNQPMRNGSTYIAVGLDIAFFGILGSLASTKSPLTSVLLVGPAVLAGAVFPIANAVILKISVNDARKLIKIFDLALERLRKQQDLLQQIIHAERLL